MSTTHYSVKRKSVLDTQLAKKTIEFEATMYRVIDTCVPSKFKSTLVRQLVDLTSSIRYHCVAALSLDIAIFPDEKLHEFYCSQIALRNVIPLLNLMNDMNAISNAQKAQLDIMLVQVNDNLSRIIHSLRKKVLLSRSVQPTGSDIASSSESDLEHIIGDGDGLRETHLSERDTTLADDAI